MLAPAYKCSRGLSSASVASLITRLDIKVGLNELQNITATIVSFFRKWLQQIVERFAESSTAQRSAYWLPDTASPGLIPSITKTFSAEEIVNVTEVNQQRCLEEGGQWLENVDQTLLVLASGKLVQKKLFAARKNKVRILYTQISTKSIPKTIMMAGEAF